MKRRDFLRVVMGVTVSTLLLPFRAIAAVWNKPAFDAVKASEAEKLLAVSNEILSKEIEIVAPDRAENGAIVQIEVKSRIPNTEAIAVLVERNPTALIGNFMFANGALPQLVTRIKMAETSDIKFIVKAGSQYFTVSKKVEVLENGCGGGGSANEKFESTMKIRAKLLPEADKENAAEIKAIITHPMHTGRGKDDFGQLIPAHFIQLVTISLNEKPVLEMQLGTGISKNPYLTFRVKGAALGDKITVNWVDSLGKTATQAVNVIAA
ncbi:MAG: thiosulfate oxidation carrier complex protein SoxZ [Methylophilaceae bacterium]